MASEPAPRLTAFPMSWVTTGRRLLIVGGGPETDARVETALRFDWAAIRVLVPCASAAVRAAAADPRVAVEERAPAEADVAAADLVFKDTTDPAVSDDVLRWCRARRVPLNATDDPARCDLHYNALVLRTPLVISVSSSGESPAAASALRRWLERAAGPGWETAARVLAAARRGLPRGHDRMNLLRGLAANPRFADLVAADDEAGLRALVREMSARFFPGPASDGSDRSDKSDPSDAPALTLGAASPALAEETLRHLHSSPVSNPWKFADADFQSLEKGRIDALAVAAEDLPDSLPAGLAVAAWTATLDPRDAIVLRAGTEWPHVRRVAARGDIAAAAVRSAVPDAEVRPAGALEAELAALDRGEIDALVAPAATLGRAGHGGRIARHLVADPRPNQGRLALVVRAADTARAASLAAQDVRRRAGLVALVGCPADPALLPAKAARYLREADVVFHDRLVPESILRPLGARACAVGKEGGHESMPQPEIHRLLLAAAERGQLAVRLHGGDPGVYGHLAEELEFLTEWGLRTDVVPAPTAAQVCAAAARAPLTDRNGGHTVTFVSGHARGDTPWTPPGPAAGNLAVYMGVAGMRRAVEAFARQGWSPDTPVTVGQDLGGPAARLVRTTLGAAARAGIEPPAVFLIGPRPHGAGRMTLRVGLEGDEDVREGPFIPWPLFDVVPGEPGGADRLERALAAAAGLVLVGRDDVAFLLEALRERGDLRRLAGLKLAALRPGARAALEAAGLTADGDVGPGDWVYPGPPERLEAEDLGSSEARVSSLSLYTLRPRPPAAPPAGEFDRVHCTDALHAELFALGQAL